MSAVNVRISAIVETPAKGSATPMRRQAGVLPRPGKQMPAVHHPWRTQPPESLYANPKAYRDIAPDPAAQTFAPPILLR